MRIKLLALLTILWASSVHAFYSDVPINSFLYPSIKYLTEKEFVKGYQDNTFGVAKPINRAEALKIILSATENEIEKKTKESPFPDVPVDAWFAPYVAYAKEKKIISGDSQTGNFSPERQVNRAEFLKMVFQSFEVNTKDHKITVSAKDVPADSWFAPYINFAAQFGILALDEGNAKPSQVLSRGESAYLLYKTLEMGRGVTPQVMLSLMDRHMAFSLQSIAGKDMETAAFAAGTAQKYGKTLSSFMGKNPTVQSATNMADAIGSLVGAYVSIQNGDMEAVISAAKNAWTMADKAQQIDSSQVSTLAIEIKKLAEALASSAREMKQ